MDGHSSFLDEGFRFHGTRLDGTQRHGFRELGQNGQADGGDGGSAQESLKHAAAVDCVHCLFSLIGTELVAANNCRGFACVANAVGMGGTNGVSARTSQFMGDMMMKSSFRPINRNLSVASICGPSDSVAVFQPAFRADRLRSHGKDGDHS